MKNDAKIGEHCRPRIFRPRVTVMGAKQCEPELFKRLVDDAIEQLPEKMSRYREIHLDVAPFRPFDVLANESKIDPTVLYVKFYSVIRVDERLLQAIEYLAENWL